MQSALPKPSSPTGVSEAAAARVMAKESLKLMLQVCDPTYQFGAMHLFLIDILQRVESGALKRVIINTPPRHGKSRLCAIEFPAWFMAKKPTRKVMAASYSGHLSSRHSMECQARVKSPNFRYLFPDFALLKSKQTADDWMTAQWGGYMATSVTGSSTGMGADLLVVDDPVKDFSEAHSPSMREKVWNWFLSTALTRLSPTGSIVIIMTRWHDDDLAGRLTSPARQTELEEAGGVAEQFQVFNLPALADPEGDLLGRPEGAALFPEKFDVAFLKARKAALGAYLWSALYCGRPMIKGGNFCDATKFQIIDPDAVPEGLLWVRFWDLATDDKTSADHTAGAKAAVDDEGNLYIADVTRGRWLWPKARARMAQLAGIERVEVGIEAVAGFKTAYQNFLEVVDPDIRVREVGVDRDKLARANPWFALADAGKVKIVRGEWNVPFIAEVSAFRPDGSVDDQVDAVSGAYAMLNRQSRIMVA